MKEPLIQWSAVEANGKGHGASMVEDHRIGETVGTSIAAVDVRVAMIVQAVIAASSGHSHHEGSHFHA